MKKLLLLVLTCMTAYSVYGATERNLLEKKATLEQVKQALIMDQKWVPFPDYYDRAGWDKFLGEDQKKEFIRQGEKMLNYEWRVTKATVYLNYDRYMGTTQAMEGFDQNHAALVRLIMAELAEGKGRFMDQLINGVYLYCEMTSWGLAAHLGARQANRSALPDNKKPVIELLSADVGSIMAWTYFFFNREFTKVNPTITERLSYEINRRMLDVYEGFNMTGNGMVNNWNPWQNSNLLQCFLIMENDRDKLAKAVHLSMRSVDKYLNYIKADGACEEGPAYWGQSAKLLDYLILLDYATGGKVSIFDEPILKNFAVFISRAYVGNGWGINFADAGARVSPSIFTVYNFGKVVKSDELMQFASFLYKNDPQLIVADRYLIRTLMNLMPVNEIKTTPAVHNLPAYTWYPETEFCFMGQSKGFFIGAKGGFNAESHNHNDAGSFNLHSNTTPIFIDAGVDTYTKKTFSKLRYTIWSMQSNYHNVPMINGVAQKDGAEFKTKNTKFDASKMCFSTDIAGTYPAEAEVKSWTRSYTLKKDELTVVDDFVLNKKLQPNQINFLTWGKVDISKEGVVTVNVQDETVSLLYNKADFTPSIEPIDLKGTALSKTWGDEIYRVSLNAKAMKTSGKYTYTIKK